MRLPCRLGLATLGWATAKVLVSTSVYEKVDYIDATLRNLVLFTSSETPVCVHVSAKIAQKDYEALAEIHAPPGGRVVFNPRRIYTRHATGSILQAHLSNVEHSARALDVAFDFVVFAASKSRLLVRGLEGLVARARFARIKDISDGLHCKTGEAYRAALWDSKRHARVRDPHLWFFEALRASSADGACRPGFSNHEGFFLPAAAALSFVDWAQSTTADVRRRRRREANVSSVLAHAADMEGALGGNAVEELYLQSYVVTLLGDAYDAAPKADVLCEHWPPRQKKVGIFSALSYRLARNMTRVAGPLAIKRWGGDAREDAVLDCWAREDAAAAADDSANVARGTIKCLHDNGLGHLLPKKQMTQVLMSHDRRAAGFSVLGPDDPFPDTVAVIDATRRHFGFAETEAGRGRPR